MRTGRIVFAEITRNNKIAVNDYTHLHALLRECAKQKDLLKGKKIHVNILKWGLLGKCISLSNALISMYAKCGVLAMAQDVFDELPVQDIVTWNALISGYVQIGRFDEAWNLFEEMQISGLCPDAVTYLCILKACGSVAKPDKGKEVHDVISRKGLLNKRCMLGTALMDMYVKCGSLEKAQEVFHELPVHDVVTWNALIAGFSQYNHIREIFMCFEQLKSEGQSPDAVTFILMLKACGYVGALEKGKEVHSEILRDGFLERNAFLGNALIDMYVKCGALAKAHQVFDDLLTRDGVTWNVIITGYCQHECMGKLPFLFSRMQCEGLCPDRVSFACMLKACSFRFLTEKGKLIHSQVLKSAWLQNNNMLGNAMINMYIKCSAVQEAQRVFDDLPFRDRVSWTTLITGYVQLQQHAKALNCLDQMQFEGFSPDAVTYASILKICGSLGIVEKGEEMHLEIIREGFWGKICMLDTAVIDMYARCGRVEKAQQVFDELQVRNVVTWTALIAGYAQLGKHDTAFSLFNKMKGEGVEPNAITFTVILNACSFMGLVDKGQLYFEMMRRSFGILPTVGHLNRMIYLFAGTGQLDRAIAIIDNFSLFSYIPAWFALLDACKKWRNAKLGGLAFRNCSRFER